MAVEVVVVGYSNNPPLQLSYVVLGVVITGVGLAWQVTQPHELIEVEKSVA
jgi:hypothetical protein